MTPCRFFATMVLAGAIGVATSAQQPANEDLPRRQYESGLSFLRGQRYVEALKDFQTVIDSFPRSSVADNAVLQVALYHLEVAGNVGAAQTAVDQLLKAYPDTDSAPMAYVVGGRLSMLKGRGPAEVDAALASFERVGRLFPGTEAVPAAGYYAGEALRLVRRHVEALDRYRSVTSAYPNSPWAAQANLAVAYCLVMNDRAAAALPEVQRVRQISPQGAVATAALNINTILYRLYVRAPALPSFGFTGRYVGDERANFEDVVGLTVDASNRVLLGHKRGIALFDPKGPLTSTIGAVEPSAFFVDEVGRVVFARNGQLQVEKSGSVAIAVPQGAPKPPRVLQEIPAVLGLSSGERIVVDKEEKAVVRVAVDGRYLGPFTNAINTERMAVNTLDDVAMIDKDGKSILVLDREGKVLSKIPPRGTNYEFGEPVDLKFDQLGHLYVLDRGRASVFVFGPKNRLITTFTIAEKSPGAFTRARLLGLDATGRLFIFDERAKRIQVYQ